MKPFLVRFLAATAVSGALLTTIAWLDGPEGTAQEPKQPAVKGNAESLSAIHCIGCHGGPDTPAYKAYSQKEEDGLARTDFILLTEHNTWEQNDIHSEAHKNIIPKLSADGKPENIAGKMQKILSKSPTRVDNKNYSVDSAAECLTCHAVDREPGPVANLAQAGGDRFNHKFGVSCEACHGLVSAEWIGQHFQKPWRKQTPDDKLKIGQIDLRDPHKKAMKCASCHIGNKEEGKFVTHEMYAAGHPPLPPFELVTYCRDQPRHYIPNRENKAIKAMEQKSQANFHYRDGELQDTRDFAIGTLAAFEATMRLLVEDAKTTAVAGTLLDFAHFDCYACHHDLKIESERRKPRPGVVPGRPMMRHWATETLQVVMDAGAGKKGEPRQSNAELGTLMERLTASFNVRPFGDADSVSKEAAALVKWCEIAKVDLQLVNYRREETLLLYRRLAKQLSEIRAKDISLDHDTAQQLAWALVVLQEELGRQKKEAPGLEQVVRLRLRGMERETVEKRLPARYQQIYGFKRDAFLDAAEGFLKAFDPK